MVKCTKRQVRELRTALPWKIAAVQRQRIQMVLLRESGMTQPAVAEAMGVSPSTVNRAHMAYDQGGLKTLKPKPYGARKRENMTIPQEKALLARLPGRRLPIMFANEARFGRMKRPRPCWAPSGIPPKVASRLIREYIYLYGAVAPKDGTCVYMGRPIRPNSIQRQNEIREKLFKN
jgi:Winged helix-turn helix